MRIFVIQTEPDGRSFAGESGNFKTGGETMTLVRRIISYLLLALIIGGIIYGLIWLRAGSLKRYDPGKAVPPGTVMFLETRDFHQLASRVRNHNNIWNEFRVCKEINRLDRQFGVIDSLARKNPDFRELLTGDMIISLNRTEEGYSTLFIITAPKHNATGQILKLIPGDSRIDKHRHGMVTLYDIQFVSDTLVPGFSFFENKGLLVISPSNGLLESAAGELSAGKGFLENADFVRLKKTAGSNVSANIYVHYPELGSFIKTIFRDGATGVVSKFAGWSALDLDIKPDFFTLNGFTTAGDSLHQSVGILQGQNPVAFGFAGVVPSNAVFFNITGFTDAGRLMENVSKYASDRSRQKKLENISAKYSFDPVAGIIPLLDGEAGSVILMNEPGEYDRYFILKVKGRGMAEGLLDEWTAKVAGAEGIKTGEYSTVADIDNHHQITLHKSPLEGFPGLLFGEFYQERDYSWYAYQENYIIFGSSPAAIRSFIYFNILGKTLENSESFAALRDNISSRSNLFIYVKPSLYLGGISSMLHPEKAKALNRNKEVWRKIDAIAFQSTSTDDLNYFRLFTHYSSHIKEAVNTVWESKLDTVTHFKPAIVVNHTNAQKEIFIQDLENNIYLISNSGSILWKQKTDDAILGDVYQVDYFHNGKLQYLFNTKEKIWLIDRNGNPVDKYPVKLREQASAGMSLFDYENDGTLRICIPTRGKDIYMYDSEGKIISGWKFGGSDYPITQPVQHRRIGKKDFIIAADQVGIYLLDRRGRTRVKPSKNIIPSPGNPVYPVAAGGGKPARILVSDTSGTVWELHYDGKTEKLFSAGVSGMHFFLPEDLNGNGKEEFIFTDGNKLLVYDDNGKLLFREEYPGPVGFPPAVYEFSSKDRKIGIVIPDAGHIYLVNNDGSLYKGFPLTGTSPFSISGFPGLKDRFNLIVGNNDNFLYNYSVK